VDVGLQARVVLRCTRCGDVIGVYEPLIVVSDGSASATSLASDPTASCAAGERYHSSCYGATNPGAHQELNPRRAAQRPPGGRKGPE